MSERSNMMTSDELNALNIRLAKADGWKANIEITPEQATTARALFESMADDWERDDGTYDAYDYADAPKYSDDLNALFALAAKVLPAVSIELTGNDLDLKYWTAQIWTRYENDPCYCDGNADTPALALARALDAWLQAKAAP